jgi:hypothetical protein
MFANGHFATNLASAGRRSIAIWIRLGSSDPTAKAAQPETERHHPSGQAAAISLILSRPARIAQPVQPQPPLAR